MCVGRDGGGEVGGRKRGELRTNGNETQQQEKHSEQGREGGETGELREP